MQNIKKVRSQKLIHVKINSLKLYYVTVRRFQLVFNRESYQNYYYYNYFYNY